MVAGVASLALLGATALLVTTPGANAATTPSLKIVGGIEEAADVTSVLPDGTTQPAGTWISTPLAQVGNSTNSDVWAVVVQLQDTTTGGLIPTTKCKADSALVGFGGTPVATNLTPGNSAKFAVKLSSTSQCQGHALDVLTIYSTQAGLAGAVVQLTGLQYKVGSTVASGPIPYKVWTDANGAGTFTTDQANAFVSPISVASAGASTLIDPSDVTTIPDIVITEKRPGAVPAAGLCISLLDPPSGTTFDTTVAAGDPTPSVTTAGGTGKAQASALSITGTTVSFTLSPATPSTVITTFTVKGLQIDAGGQKGPIDAVVTQAPCAAGAVQFAPTVRLATIGTIDRIAGENRYATAAAIAKTQYDQDLAGRTIVLARGDNFPDALAASYLAGQNDVPILLVTPTSVPNETLQFLATHGATDVVLVGGTTAISSKVQTYLDQFPTFDYGSTTSNGGTLTVTRVGGADRYQTAKLVAEAPGLDQGGTLGVSNENGCSAAKTAIVASGENFPDALAAGGLAFHGATGCGQGSIPLLLTQKDGLTPATVVALSELGVQQVLLVGGPNAIVPAVETAIDNLPGISVKRVFGNTRQQTAIALADTVLGPAEIGGWQTGSFLVARPDTFPDALVSSSLSGGTQAPLFLATSPTDLGADVVTGVHSYPVGFGDAHVIGGTTALSAHVFDQVAATLASQP